MGLIMVNPLTGVNSPTYVARQASSPPSRSQNIQAKTRIKRPSVLKGSSHRSGFSKLDVLKYWKSHKFL